MGRVINTNNPGKRRSAAMRTIAEILRRLGQHQGSINDDVRDMVAMIVFCLKEIDDTVIESIEAWEKRGYWQKADKFQVEWMWAEQSASRIERMLRGENWNDEKEWQGCYDRLMSQVK
jgi:hypothetical protein